MGFPRLMDACFGFLPDFTKKYLILKLNDHG